mmetsp:Transcript_10796/g.30926  ORF Transcript_10796/g.30926 Transcript_10796/m.30926 type:complete len:650 (-) Transcript_10796:63-2012(-)
MPIGQGWLNAWVKVNSKHVIFPSTSSASSHENQDDEAGGGGGAGDHQGDDHHAGRRRSGSGTQGNAATASPSSQTRNQIRKRMNSRKLKRGQQKRHGTSDYLSSSLKRKGKGGKDSVSSGSTRRPKSISIGSHDDLLNDESSRTAITAATATQHMDRRTQTQQHNDPNAANSIDGARAEMQTMAAGSAGVGRGVNNIGSGGGGVGIGGIAPAAASLDARSRDDGASRAQNKGKDPSLNFVSGLFGGNLESRAQHFHQHQKQHDTMSVQHLQDRRMLETSSLASHGGHSAPVGGGSSRPATKKNDSLFSGGQGGLTLMFPFADGNGRCKSCKELEDDLTRCREDLETARNLALHYEMSLQQSNDTSSAANSMPASDGVLEKSIDGVHATTTMGSNNHLLASVVNQMNDMSIQHKKEMERLTKEKILWKQETHPKIQMFASLCKELDEEATLRNAEANSLHDELEKVVMERDTLATELAKLKVDAQQLEVHQTENRQLKAKLQFYEEHGINGADESIKARDHIIEQLMLRLKKATDTLDAEREQHLQRRKIIFPRPASSNVNGSSSTSGGGGSLNNSNSAAVESSERSELRATKTSLQEAENAIEKLKLEHHRKELEWIRQMEQLKRKAEDAGGELQQQNEQQQRHAVMDR